MEIKSVIAKNAYDMGWAFRIAEKALTIDQAIDLNPYNKEYSNNIRYEFFLLGFKNACDYLKHLENF